MSDDRTDNERRWHALMVAAQGGERAAYAALLGEIVPFLRAVLRRRYPYLTREDVEDAVQEVLVSIHSVRSTYDPVRPFLPWLMAIAHNRAVDAVRRTSRRSQRETAVAEYPETLDAAEANTSSEEAYGDPEALRQAVAGLPEGQRKAVEMLRFRELSLKEAAAESGMSVGALKVAVHRATRTLRVVLGRRDADAD